MGTMVESTSPARKTSAREAVSGRKGKCRRQRKVRAFNGTHAANSSVFLLRLAGGGDEQFIPCWRRQWNLEKGDGLPKVTQPVSYKLQVTAACCSHLGLKGIIC